MRKKIMVILTLVSMIVLVVSCSIESEKVSVEDVEFCPVSSVFIGGEKSAEIMGKVPIHLYYTDNEKQKLCLEIRQISIKKIDKNLNEFCKIIMEELLKGSEKNSNIISEDVELISLPRIIGDYVEIELNKDFVKGFKVDIREKELMIYSIVNSLTDVKELNRVSILVNGKKISEYEGFEILGNEFERNDKY